MKILVAAEIALALGIGAYNAYLYWKSQTKKEESNESQSNKTKSRYYAKANGKIPRVEL